MFVEILALFEMPFTIDGYLEFKKGCLSENTTLAEIYKNEIAFNWLLCRRSLGMI